MKSTAAAQPAKSEGSDFCSLYATQVAQGLVNIRTATAGGAAVAEGIADQLAKKAPVTQAQLQAVAPPEPLAWLKALEKANAAGASGDISASGDVFTNLSLLNDWSIKNCDAKYRPIFTEYKGDIG